MKHLSSVIAFVLLLALGVWYFNRKKGTGNIPNLEAFVDPYKEIRRIHGGYSDSKWTGSNKGYNTQGYWIIITQDYAAYDPSQAHYAAQAFIKGWDIHPDTWIFRSALKTDFREYLDANLGIMPDLVRKGQYVLI